MMFDRECTLCTSESDSDRSTARTAAKVGARVGAAAGSRAGPFGAGLGSGIGGATGYLAGALIDDVKAGFNGPKALPDGGRPQSVEADDAERVAIPVTESDAPRDD